MCAYLGTFELLEPEETGTKILREVGNYLAFNMT